ncbi:uncharacterized protein EI97DRAFT_465331 [Westerdykella ornata]|uniref:Uncharacterized protein n=1 Tax=Westerdykella ornata TaxID=318751 RepID=A0A6A6JSX3_WESOR|nr:uncharacterized protein EI97DRAFT_465331 [Westerdykella ornata]KAF2278968.1 hypothetical protein EI97DRAFT_465331 [Westerdykella ornata]
MRLKDMRDARREKDLALEELVMVFAPAGLYRPDDEPPFFWGNDMLLWIPDSDANQKLGGRQPLPQEFSHYKGIRAIVDNTDQEISRSYWRLFEHIQIMIKNEKPENYLPKLRVLARRRFWAKENYRTPVKRCEPAWEPADQRVLRRIIHLVQAAEVDNLYLYKEYGLERLGAYIKDPPQTRRCDKHQSSSIPGCYHQHVLYNLVNDIFGRLLSELQSRELETAEYYFNTAFRSESDRRKEEEEKEDLARSYLDILAWTPERLRKTVREEQEQRQRTYLGPSLQSFSDVSEADREREDDRRRGKRPCLSVIRRS